MNNEKKGILYVVLSALAFGSMAIFGKLAQEAGTSVETLLTWRFLLASVVLWMLTKMSGQTIKVGWRLSLASFALGAIGYASMSYSFFAALEEISASLTAMLLYTYPLFVTIWTVLLRWEKLTFRKGIALLLITTGVWILLGQAIGPTSLRGVLLGGAAGFIYSFFILVNRRVGQSVPALTLTAYTSTGAFVTFTCASMWQGSLTFPTSSTVWMSVVMIALLSTCVAITLFTIGVQKIGASRASMLSTLEPVFTVLLSMVVFGDVLNPLQWTGAAVVLVSLLLLQSSESSTPTEHSKLTLTS